MVVLRELEQFNLPFLQLASRQQRRTLEEVTLLGINHTLEE